jgi:hypothetical protein
MGRDKPTGSGPGQYFFIQSLQIVEPIDIREFRQEAIVAPLPPEYRYRLL